MFLTICKHCITNLRKNLELSDLYMSVIGATDFKSSRYRMISRLFSMFAILSLESVLPRRCLLPNQVSPQGSLYCSPPPSLLGTWVWTPPSCIMHSCGKLSRRRSLGALHVLILNSMTTSTTLPTTSIFSKYLSPSWMLLCNGAETGTITV